MNLNQTATIPFSRVLAQSFAGAGWLIAAWTLGMISVPILLWTVGDWTLPWIITVNVIVLAAANIVILVRNTSLRAALRIIAVVITGSWGVEYLGSTTGFPFSHYDYTPLLQPQVAGVPAIIPLAWLMMLPAAWVIGQLLAPGRPLFQVIVAGLAMTAWDLFLDPQMVGWNFWHWAEDGGYYGIPWLNFAGWFLASVVLTVAAQPPALPVRPFLVIYTLTWALQTIGLAFFWNMPGPAFWGFVAMGLFVAVAWRRHLRDSRRDQFAQAV